MACFSCSCKGSCTALAVIVSAILGVLAAFLQITGAITVTTTFLWVVFGIGVGYLAVTLYGAARGAHCPARCICPGLTTLLAGVLGSILLSVILLAVGITATSTVSAVLVGLLVLFFALTITGAACLVRCLFDCET